MTQKAKILLVEDDESLGFVIKDNLEQQQFEVDLCADGESGWNTFNKNKYDICILDVMLPKKDGFTIIENIRKINEHIPVLFLTARAQKEDKIAGFKKGADDYITKPFSIEELILRIDVFLKRTKVSTAVSNQFTIGTYTFNYKDLSLSSPKKKISLTQKEADLIRHFYENKNKLIKREEILKTVWGTDDYFMGRSLDVFISRLRKYFSEDKSLEITNHFGVGFTFVILEK